MKSLLMGYALELFDINPLNFLVKPLSYEQHEDQQYNIQSNLSASGTKK